MLPVVDQSRRSLFRGRLRPRAVLRPPWSQSEQQFLHSCNRCQRCVAACQTGVLICGDGGFPEPDFSRAECSFCQACVEACPTGALDCTLNSKPWSFKAQINDHCLATNRVHCRSCSEHCEPEAIRFQLHPGGIAQPHIELELCSGCGACVGSCPVAAISIQGDQEKTL